MIVRFVKDSLRRAPRRKALIVAAIAMGSAVATSMLGVMLSIGDKVNRELRSAGANIVVTGRAASVTGGIGNVTAKAGTGYIAESDVPKIKNIFWGLNIVGIAPSLAAQDKTLRVSGVDFKALRTVNPAWSVVGRWAEDMSNDCMVGEGISRREHWKLKQDITVLGAPCKISGVVSSGDEADDQILLPLKRVQELAGHTGVVDRIDVAALTKPEDDFARKDPRLMTAAEFERWNCTNYVVSIAHEIEEALPGTQARPVRRVADSEGKVLDKVGGLMGLITLAALFSAGLTVWSLTATTMIERRGEIAIMQAIGGSRSLIALLLGLEIAMVGLLGGIVGAFTGVGLAHFVGQSVFSDAIEISPVLPFVIIAAAVLVALAGAAQPLRRALLLEPASILREGV
jgi:putative ABC transport system permease protein